MDSFSAEAFSTSAFSANDFGIVETPETGLGNIDWLHKRKKEKKKRPKVLYWHDYANSEERTVALANALAEAAIPVEAPGEDDSVFEDEDDLIISMVMSRLLN